MDQVEKSSSNQFQASPPSYLKSELIPLKLQDDLPASCREYLSQCREVIFEKMQQGVSITRLVHLQSLMCDQLVVGLHKRAIAQEKDSVPPMALLALGGYGRSELNLFSDLDLLWIHDDQDLDSLKNTVEKMLYPLWDAKEEVGYAIRTIADCRRVVGQDVRTMSSILDARFLAGDAELAKKFFHFLESKISSQRALKNFLKRKMNETKDRLKRFGGSVYVISPNLKESEGGLRDWHTLRYFAKLATKSARMDAWIHAQIISNEEAESLRQSVEFLWQVRNRLHHLTGKAHDQLDFEFQTAIAGQMGFETSEDKLGVEKFMQSYYAHAAELHRLRQEVTRRILTPPRSFWSRLKNQLRPSLSAYFINMNGKVLPKIFRKLELAPVEILRAFAIAQKKSLEIDAGFKAWIRRHLHLIDEDYRCHPEVAKIFRGMLSDISGIGNSLAEMHDCGLLGVLLPEFGEILHQTQHDMYHVYTVDAHSIKAVQELSALQNAEYDKEFPIFKKAMQEIGSSEILVLGTFFHDVGKGKGGRHAEVGADLARKVMSRLGYAEEEIEQVAFLVLSHLMMPHLSQRRDLEDAKLIQQFAKTVENLERLNLLFVLTWADIRAVGPDVWTPWKGALLRELYQKTSEVLTKGDYTAERAVRLMEQAKKEVLNCAPKRFSQGELEAYLSVMPPRYFLAMSPEAILEHFETLSQAKNRQFVFRATDHVRGKYHEVLFYILNSPKLFVQVTGVMAANQVNILALEQFFDKQGQALLWLRVTNQQGGLFQNYRVFKKVEQDLREIFEGKISLEEYYQKRFSAPLLSKTPSQRPPRVEIDQDVSPYYTVIDIYGNDRLGLLYDLAQVMARFNLFVEVSKISTKVDQVSDVFYVKDIFSQKIKDSKKVREVKAALLEVLTQNQE